MGKGIQEPRAGKDDAARRRRKKREDDYETHLICRVCGEALKAISWHHLKRHDMTPRRYKELYGDDYLLSPHSRARISRANAKRSRLGAARYRPRESKAEIRLGLLALARRLGWPGREVSIPELRSKDPSLVEQADNAFGSMTKVKEACGFKVRFRRKYPSKDTVVDALRRCAKAEGSVADVVLKKQDSALSAAVDRNFGSLAEAARVLGLPYRPRYESWSAKRVRKAIRRRSRKGLPLNPAAILKSDNRLYCAAVRRFGSWKAAMEASGLDYVRAPTAPGKWTLEVLEQGLRHWVRKHGPLNYMKLRLSDAALCSAAGQRYGGIEKTARALGLPYASRLTHWDKAQVLRKIRERVKAGLPLNAGAMKRKRTAALVRAATRLFGSWDKALISAGVEAETVRKRYERDVEAMTHRLRAWVKRHGPLNHTALKKSDARLCSSVVGWKGTVAAGAKALDLPYQSRLVNWTKPLVLARIRERKASGRDMNVASVQKDNSRLVRAAYLLFSTWDKALTGAGIDPAKVRRREHRDPAAIERQLRLWVMRHGPLNYTALRRSDGALCGAVESTMGTVSAAARKLGLPYMSRLTKWSKTLVLRRIKELHAAESAVNAKEVHAAYSGMYAAGVRDFGSWDNALKAAGVDPATVRLR